jgi:hypothetical protein
MRKRIIKLLNNKYPILQKLIKKQTHFSKAKVYDYIFYQLLINAFIIKSYFF